MRTSVLILTALALVVGLCLMSETAEAVRTAADCICQDLTRKLTGERASDRYYRTVTKLGQGPLSSSSSIGVS